MAEHKYAEILRHIADGGQVDVRNFGDPDWVKLKLDREFWINHSFEYRKRPPKKMYRVAKMEEGGISYVAISDLSNSESHFCVENPMRFVRWLTDWIEYD